MADRALWAFVPCGLCGGTGESDYGLDECDECAGTGDQYVNPTAADLLTDPRVRALVEALRPVVLRWDPDAMDDMERRLIAALVPFEEVSRG